MVRRRDDPKRPPATHLWPPPTFSSCRSRVLPHGPLLLPPPAVSRSRHTLTGRAAHGSPPRRPQTPDGTPAFGRRPPFRLAAPRLFGRPRLLRSPPSARNRHALTGSVAHGTPPKRPQTPDGTPAFGRRLPFPLAGAASFRTAPALAAARRFPEPSHLDGARPMERRRDARKRPPATHLWPPALFSCRRRHTLPRGLPLLPPPAVSRSRHTLTGRAAHGSPPRRPQTPAGGPPLAARPFLLPSPSHLSARPPALAAARRFLLPAPRALSGSRADGRFFMRAQGFARTCRVLPAHVEYY